MGSWMDLGVDPGIYARELMAKCKEAAARIAPCQSAPVNILVNGFYDTNKIVRPPLHLCSVAVAVFGLLEPPPPPTACLPCLYPLPWWATLGCCSREQHAALTGRVWSTPQGSSTACVLVLEGDTLHAANLGDSGFMVLRGKKILMRSRTQQHQFNFPYQVPPKPFLAKKIIPKPPCRPCAGGLTPCGSACMSAKHLRKHWQMQCADAATVCACTAGQRRQREVRLTQQSRGGAHVPHAHPCALNGNDVLTTARLGIHPAFEVHMQALRCLYI